MTRQSAAPLTHLVLDQTNRTASEMARLASEGITDVNAPYQRGSVWTLDQRIALVRSWLLGLPVPAILLNNRYHSGWIAANGVDPAATGRGMYGLVDGKQRVETAMAWFGGEFAVPASWFEAEDVEVTEATDDGPYVRFTGLTTSCQTSLSFRSFLPVIESRVATIAEEADLYLVINGGGTPQTPDDMDNARAHASEM